MSNVLEKIVSVKRQEIAKAKAKIDQVELTRQCEHAPPVRDFLQAVATAGEISLIAEVKKASPSKGIIRDDFNPVEIAKTYQENGARCISVLTDREFFQGDLQYLKDVRATVDIPILRKDFILDPYQVFEARAAGADAVLLIAECLSEQLMVELHDQIVKLGMTPLVEFYAPENLDKVVASGAKLIGVNNRDLRSFKTDLDHTVRMRKRIPDSAIVVGESGIHTYAEAQMLKSHSIDAMLVGESLMRCDDIGLAVRRLLRGEI